VTARTTKRHILLGNLVIDEALCPRKRVSAARVEEFLALLKTEPAALPAIVVVADNERLVLADGRHRLVATGRLGITRCTACVLEVPEDLTSSQLVLIAAINAVATATLPLTPADRKRARDLLLEHYPTMSLGEADRRVRMSRQSVSGTRSARRTRPSRVPERAAASEEAVVLVGRMLSAWGTLQSIGARANVGLAPKLARAKYGLEAHVTGQALSWLTRQVSAPLEQLARDDAERSER